jgi:hypothetical protein
VRAYKDNTPAVITVPTEINVLKTISSAPDCECASVNHANKRNHSCSRIVYVRRRGTYRAGCGGGHILFRTCPRPRVVRSSAGTRIMRFIIFIFYLFIIMRFPAAFRWPSAPEPTTNAVTKTCDAANLPYANAFRISPRSRFRWRARFFAPVSFLGRGTVYFSRHFPSR